MQHVAHRAGDCLMAKWSGRGIPPTRRKLHKWRQAQLKARQAELKAQRQEVAGLDASYRGIKRAIINEDRFVALWTDEPILWMEAEGG